MSSIVSAGIFTRLFTKAFLLGTYLVSFFVCLRWLLFSDDGGSLRKRVDRLMLITTLFLFAFALTDFGLFVYLTFSQSAYTWAFDIIVSSPEFELSYSRWLDSVQSFVEVSTSIILDAVLVRESESQQPYTHTSCQIYRCWLIYGKSWNIAIFPLFLWLYNVSCLFMFTYWNCADASPKTILLCSDIRMPFFASSVTVNVYTTCTWKHYVLHSVRLTLDRNWSCHYMANLAE